MYCTKCGFKQEEQDRYCLKCGNKLDKLIRKGPEIVELSSDQNEGEEKDKLVPVEINNDANSEIDEDKTGKDYTIKDEVKNEENKKEEKRLFKPLDKFSRRLLFLTIMLIASLFLLFSSDHYELAVGSEFDKSTFEVSGDDIRAEEAFHVLIKSNQSFEGKNAVLALQRKTVNGYKTVVSHQFDADKRYTNVHYDAEVKVPGKYKAVLYIDDLKVAYETFEAN